MAIYELAPTTRVCLEYNNFSVVPYAYNTGFVGHWYRAVAIGYTLETLLQFDLTPYAGATVNSVQFRLVSTSKGIQSTARPSAIFEQNKKPPAFWSTPPVFDDFAISAWSNQVSNTVNVNNTGTYLYSDIGTAFKTLVQSWIDDSSLNHGIIAAADFQAINHWLNLTGDSRLIIDIDEVDDDVLFHTVNRGVAEGVNIGIG